MENLFQKETGYSFNEMLNECKTNKDIIFCAWCVLIDLISSNKNTEYLVDYTIKLAINSKYSNYVFDVFNPVLNDKNTNQNTVKVIAKKLIDIRYQNNNNDIIDDIFIKHYDFLISKIITNTELLNGTNKKQIQSYLENAKLEPANKLITDINDIKEIKFFN